MAAQTAVVEEILGRYPRDASSLIMVLQEVQDALGHVPEEAVGKVAEGLGVPRSRVWSAATFYKSFSLKPLGKHRIEVCTGTACHVRGAEGLVERVREEVGIGPGETSEDREFSLHTVHCVGACALGPVVIADGEVHGEMTPRKLSRVLERCRCAEAAEAQAREAEEIPLPARLEGPEGLRAWREALHEARKQAVRTLSVCAGSGCRALGADKVIAAFEAALEERGLSERVRIQRNGCHGFCEAGVAVVVRPEGIFYKNVKPRDAAEIVERTLERGEAVERLLYEDPETGKKVRLEKEIPFYARQERRLMARNARIDPLRIEDYVAEGGYAALAKALFEMERDGVVDAVRRAGLRGRGGGGFHAARKWAACRKVPSEVKYILCNADEGDPGAFMDCSLLEGNPHSVIEGMVIGAWAVAGRDARPEGYVYVRHEYPVAVANLERALRQARAAGLLGENILGSGFSYDIRISRGGGSFVCGESTALMASIEGKIGEPRAKYVHTSTAGLYGKPTVLNNVESWANVPLIVGEGPEAWAALGNETCKGTKIFSLVGKVQNTGLVEVPMGTPLREIVFGIGGGIREGRAFKAVQTGGPSGGCVPEKLLDLPVDFEALTKAGSMMGSGGMIVMDERTCMVDVARYFTAFLTEESCGKCTACRLGLANMKEILDRICAGEGRPEDLERLEQLFTVLDEGSLCGLGKSAANPVRSPLTYCREEYEAHVKERRCPAGVCKALITYYIDASACTGCTLCAKDCPAGAITGEKEQPHVIDEALCTRCGACAAVCTFDAVKTR